MKKLLRMAFMALSLLVCSGAWADDWTHYTDVSGTTKLGLQSKIANREQLTNVPTIYLDIPDVKTIDSDLTKKIDPATGDVKYHKATIQVVDNSEASSTQHLESFIDSELEIKVRGNSTSSAGNEKRPYRLKFASKKTSSDGVAHKHDLLGLGYEKRNWTLLANAFDMSMIRNAITYHLGKYVGMDFCPGYKFVDLVINDDYRGTYQVSDQVEVDADRVNINEDTDWFLEGVAWNTMVEQPATSSGEPYMCIKNPEPETDEEISALISEVEAWRTTWLASFDSQSSKTGWPATNDVESLIKYYIAINITADIDGWFVFKGYRTPTGPFTWGPLWDKDLAYGNWGQADPNKLVEYYSKCNFEWKIQGLLSQPLFVNQAKAFIDELIDNNLYSKLEADIDRIASQLQQTQALNYQLYSITDTGSGSVVRDTYAEYIQQLKDFLNARIPFVQSALAEKIEALPAPEEAVYNVENAWWSTGLTQNKEYNMSVSNRTLKGGEWNTFCLPFDATEAQMKSSLGCDYELAVHSGMDTDNKTMLFSSPASLNIEAGVPYLIKPAKDVNSFGKFNSVYYTVNVNNGQNAYNGEGVTFDNNHYFYASLFHGYELNKTTDYLFSDDVYVDNTSFVKTTTDNQNGCRAYIRVPEGETAAIKFGETVIENLEFNVNDGAASAEKVGGTYNIQLKNRGKLFADGWCTICLPFTITKKNFEAAIGYDTKLRELSSIEGSSFNFDKIADKTMKAGVPYLIMIDNTDTSITKDLGTVVFNNTKLEATEGTSVSPKEGYAFVGILEAKQLANDGTQLFMGANSELYKPSSTSGKLGGGRAYFKIPSKASTSGAKISVTIDGIVTSIEEQIKNAVEPKHSRVFNLNGQKINSSNLQSLPHGIYIINGKKVMK